MSFRSRQSSLRDWNSLILMSLVVLWKKACFASTKRSNRKGGCKSYVTNLADINVIKGTIHAAENIYATPPKVTQCYLLSMATGNVD